MNEKEEYKIRCEFGTKLIKYSMDKEITYAEFEKWFIDKLKQG